MALDSLKIAIASNGKDSLQPSLYFTSPKTPHTRTHARSVINSDREIHTFRRASSMSRLTVDAGSMEAAPPPPATMIGGEFYHMSPRYLRNAYSGDFHVEMADFLRSCGLCNRHLAPGHDIYMYRGDTAFCSLDCREQQMEHDERNERRAAPKSGESHHQELAAAAAEAEMVAAA